MGHLKKGTWVNDKVASSAEDGSFAREESHYRKTIAENHGTYQPESKRYHLYASYACPWAHRTLITRKLKKLEPHITVSFVHPHMLENGWSFASDFPGADGDPLYNKKYLYEIYQEDAPEATTKVTVPVLWDKKTKSIVNNESSEIIRIFNDSFDELAGVESKLNLYPPALRPEIDAMNALTYEPINNGVYKAGFAENQKAYEKAFNELFQSLDKVDEHLASRRFLVQEQLTEADVRLVTTLLRFDSVYYVHFKCNAKKISEYKHLSQFLARMHAMDAVKSTTRLDHIKSHYYYSHDFINPKRIIPLGPREELLFVP